jgi:hypothetical protein
VLQQARKKNTQQKKSQRVEVSLITKTNIYLHFGLSQKQHYVTSPYGFSIGMKVYKLQE